MGFIRVRQADGPAHEFDISEAAYKRNKRAYVVIDSKPVVNPRSTKYVAEKPKSKATTAVAGKETA